MNVLWSGFAGLGGAFVVATAHAQWLEPSERRTAQAAPSGRGDAVDRGSGRANERSNERPNERSNGRNRGNAAATVTPRVFLFEGNAVISTRELTALLAPWIGKTLNFSALNAVADTVRDYYQKRGFILASAYLPEQQVNTGVVRIAIQEGKLGQVRLKQPFDAGVRVSEEQVQAIITANVREGVPVSEESLERPLLLIEDLAGAKVRSSLGRGSVSGAADLEIEVVPDQRKAPITGSIEADNFGSTATGSNRLTLKIDVNGLMRFGDTLKLQGFATNQRLSVFGNASYQLPIGSDGTRVGVSTGKLSYSLGGEFAALEAGGTARTFEINASHPFVRGRTGNVVGSVAFENKKSSNVQAFGSRQETSISNLKLQLAMDMREGRSSGVLVLGLTAGNVYMADAAQRGVDQSVNGFNTSGRFQKLTFDAQRLVQIGPRINLLLKGAGQLASKNLSGVEKFSLGGPDRVRGYAPGTGSGDSGFFASAELRTPVSGPGLLGDGLSVAGFFDIGHVQRNRKLGEAPANDRQVENSRTLGSYGVGLRLGQDERFLIRADLARTANDANATLDGGKNKTQFWVQTAIWF